jgi:hypothetical protein
LSITNKESLVFLKVIGCFFILVIVSTNYFRHFQYGQYTLGVITPCVVICLPFIAMLTAFWHQKLSHQKIEVTFGTKFFTKKYDYTGLEFIKLNVGSTTNTSGPSSEFLTIDMKVRDRKAHIGIFTKESWSKCSADEIVNEVMKISKVTGISTIKTSERFDYLYSARFNKEFKIPSKY